MEKIIKVKKNEQIKKSFITDLRKSCDVVENEDYYICSNISNENLFVYTIAITMVNSLYNSYLTNILLRHFKKSKVKEILKNHEEKSYEKNHLAFLIKITLDIYLYNNDVINFNSFIKFNCPKVLEELDSIAELEVDADGEFLNDVDSNIDEEIDNKYMKITLLYKYLEMSNIDKPDVLDLHIFKDKGKIRITNEYLKDVSLGVNENIKTLASEIYGKEIKKDSDEYQLINFNLCLLLLNPERLVLYKSLGTIEEDYIKDFSFFKVNLELDSECYKSNEERPSI